MTTKIRPIPKYYGYYADEEGNIYSAKAGFMRKLAQRVHKNYYHVSVRDSGFPTKTHKEPVHKLVLNAFVGERHGDLVCRHLNGNSLDNRLINLRWGTAKENAQDSIKHGTAVCLRHGENAVAAKLKLYEVLNIKKLYRQGATQKLLGRMFNVTQRHISDIICGNTWKRDVV